MKYYLKSTLIPFIYLIFTMATALGIVQIDGISDGLAILLSIGNCLIYLFICGAFSFKHGEKAYKTLLDNDITRRYIIETGEDRPINRTEEYAPWKGFFMGFLVCVPLVLLNIIHLIIFLTGSTYSGIGYIAGIIYDVFFAVFNIIFKEPTSSQYFLTMIALPLLVGVSGVLYLFGARKTKMIDDKIKQKQQYLHGEKK